MATRTPTTTRSGDGSSVKRVFTGLTNDTADVTAPFPFGARGDMSVQFLGTFGAGGTVVWEGSNDGGTTWATLTDPQGNAISRTTPGIETVMEFSELARARVTAGDATTNITVAVVTRRNNYQGG